MLIAVEKYSELFTCCSDNKKQYISKMHALHHQKGKGEERQNPKGL